MRNYWERFCKYRVDAHFVRVNHYHPEAISGSGDHFNFWECAPTLVPETGRLGRASYTEHLQYNVN